jgi:hypothetical protein
MIATAIEVRSSRRVMRIRDGGEAAAAALQTQASASGKGLSLGSGSGGRFSLLVGDRQLSTTVPINVGSGGRSLDRGCQLSATQPISGGGGNRSGNGGIAFRPSSAGLTATRSERGGSSGSSGRATEEKHPGVASYGCCQSPTRVVSHPPHPPHPPSSRQPRSHQRQASGRPRSTPAPRPALASSPVSSASLASARPSSLRIVHPASPPQLFSTSGVRTARSLHEHPGTRALAPSSTRPHSARPVHTAHSHTQLRTLSPRPPSRSWSARAPSHPGFEPGTFASAAARGRGPLCTRGVPGLEAARLLLLQARKYENHSPLETINHTL